MIWTILALVALLVLGASIAYLGDLQGRRWGKRRVSWFSLRPRHTAALVTSLTGAAIAGLSVVILFGAVPAVRDVLLNGEYAIRQNRSLVVQLQQRNAEYSLRSREYHNQIAMLDWQAAVARRQRDDDIQLQARLAQRLTARKAALRAVTARLAQSEAKQVTLQRANVRTRADLASAEFHMARYTAQNKSVGQQNLDLMRQKSTLESDLMRLKADDTRLELANEIQARANAQFRADGDRLKQQNAAMKSQDDATYADYLQERDLVAGLKNQVAALTSKRDDLYQQLTGAGESYVALRHSKLILPAGAELARCTVAPHLDSPAVLQRLQNLFADAAATARRYRAGAGDNGREVRILTKHIVTLTGEEDAGDDASLQALASTLAGSDSPVVVTANAVNNSMEGEQVVMELTPHAVARAVIFDRGAVVASRNIDASKPRSLVIDEILSFLQNDVKDAAIGAGIVPRVDPDTGKDEVGIVGPKDLVSLCIRVFKVGGPVQLTAVARTPVASGDALAVSPDESGGANLDVRVARARGGDRG